VLIPETGPVTDRLRVREIDDDEGQRLVRIIRRGSGSVVTWRRAQTVLLPAQGMDVAAIAKVAFTSEDRCGMGSATSTPTGSARCTRGTGAAARRSSPWPSGGRSRRSPRPSRPSTTCRFPTWSLAKLADFLVVDDISREGLRVLLREEGVTFQRINVGS
jgi:hypothetical protein